MTLSMLTRNHEPDIKLMYLWLASDLPEVSGGVGSGTTDLFLDC